MSFHHAKKILVVAESIDVEDSSGTKGRVALVKNLVKIGYDLEVYHYTPKEIHLKGIKCVKIPEDRRSLLFFLSRTERYLRYFLKIYLHNYLETIFGFSFTLMNDRNSIVKALRKKKAMDPDLILTLSKGGSFRPHHALLKMPEWHHKWAAYIHDPYPMHVYPKPYTWKEPGFEKKEKFMKDMSEAAAVSIFPSKLLMEWMGGFFKGYLKKGIVIPHQIDEEKEQKQHSVQFPEYFDKEKFNILHAGNLLWGRDPFGLIHAFRKFARNDKEKMADCRLIFIGPQNHYSEELLQLHNSDEPFFMSKDSLSFSVVQQLQKVASVNVILEAKSEISPFLPGKFPHCVLANKTILLLGPPYSESRRLLGEKYPYWAEIDDENTIENILEALYLKWKANAERLLLNREDLEEYLSINYLENTFQKCMDSL